MDSPPKQKYIPPHLRNRASGTAIAQEQAPNVFPAAFNRCPFTAINSMPFSRSGYRRDGYTETSIRNRVLGGTTHTFVRCALPLPGSADHPELWVDPSVAGLPWDETICRIMVHLEGHLSPPEELWTRHGFDLLASNQNRRIPVFMQMRSKKWEYKGRYEVVGWTVHNGGSEEVRSFIMQRGESKKPKSAEAWATALGEDWACVQVRLSDDQSLGNPMDS
ncbi:hypothetical protein CALCODRAFT_493042 [Calocera cornea HHB12733]|uniref:Uncharacterized protein n=1 Tax=Calocera cornea HHB12733 TaxID=1353952 RepID=A0A165I2B2_9BASI|nr:hypothetical protein CALCODRAFT_493042 [Calocera cornea HHB12733]